MRHLYRFFVFFFLLTISVAHQAFAQQVPATDTSIIQTDTTVNPVADTTLPVTSVDADLMNIFNQRTPKKYKIANITVSGNHYFDQALLVSISTLTVGEEVVIPGGDNFAKTVQFQSSKQSSAAAVSVVPECVAPPS